MTRRGIRQPDLGLGTARWRTAAVPGHSTPAHGTADDQRVATRNTMSTMATLVRTAAGGAPL
jgi:hypothetical protein